MHKYLGVTVARTIVLAVLLALVASLIAANALTIVVTFPSLAYDLKLVACPDDRIVALVPPGVDPHEYQLKPSDVELLKKADLIVSTGHTPFEKRIEELVESGVVSAELIVTWRVPGIRLLRNPVTGQPNLHMPIYDPRNYLAFMKALVGELSRLRPECSRVYHEKLAIVEERVKKLLEEFGGVYSGRVAVSDLPFTQYAVEWMGLRLEALLVPEPGVPTNPELLSKAESLLKHGAVAVVTSPAVHQASKRLLELASTLHAPVLHVPSPLAPGSIIEKLERIAGEALAAKRRVAGAAALFEPGPIAWYTLIAAASAAFGVLSVVVAARRLYFLAAGLPHSSLLAATIAIPLALLTGVNEYIWAVIVAVVLVFAFDAMLSRGVDPDVAASVFVAASASASVAAIYYVLSNYPVQAELWAYILGDPLLAPPSSILATLVASILTITALILTYREQVCIGVDPIGARLAGLRVRLYDTLLLSVLAASMVLLLRSVGFVIEHVMVLLPGAIASTLARGMWRTLAAGVAAALAAGLAGLTISLFTGIAPAAAIGGVAVALYAAALAGRR